MKKIPAAILAALVIIPLGGCDPLPSSNGSKPSLPPAGGVRYEVEIQTNDATRTINDSRIVLITATGSTQSGPGFNINGHPLPYTYEDRTPHRISVSVSPGARFEFKILVKLVIGRWNHEVDAVRSLSCRVLREGVPVTITEGGVSGFQSTPVQNKGIFLATCGAAGVA